MKGECVKATVVWNTCFTENHVIIVNSVSAGEFRELFRDRQWIKLTRSDKRNESPQLYDSRDQTEIEKFAKMD